MSNHEAPITSLFPDDIILEILTHLPSKDACRFKLVSKRSNALISHTHFLSTYLSRNPPSSWVPLGRTIRISYACLFPIRLPLSQVEDIHTLYINPDLLLKPGELIPSWARNMYPAGVLHVSSGLVLFTVNVVPDPDKVSIEKYADYPQREWYEFRNGKYVLTSGVDKSDDLLFVINPVTKEWARLPTNPYLAGGGKTLHRYTHVLVACGATGEFVIGVYAPFEGNRTLACYSSRTGKWVKKKANYPLGSRVWYPYWVFELKGKMYWADYSVGIIKWEVGDVFTAATSEEEAVCVFIPLPKGRATVEDCKVKGNVMSIRHVGPTEGKWIQYMELMEEGEVGLEMLRLMDNKEWSLLYKVSRLNLERGLGLGKDAVEKMKQKLQPGWPNWVKGTLFIDPFDAGIAVLKTRERIFFLNVRTQVVVTTLSFVGHSLVTPFVLPNWRTHLPPRLYAEYLKEQGNENFKAQHFMDAIKYYSKSIAVSPTATTYANRAMAYLKVSKFREAEDDCTEALNLDGGYCKVFVRRALARKELDNLDGALEDINRALSLERNSEEVKKRHAEIKSLHEKASAAKGEQVLEGASSDVELEDKSVDFHDERC